MMCGYTFAICSYIGRLRVSVRRPGHFFLGGFPEAMRFDTVFLVEATMSYEREELEAHMYSRARATAYRARPRHTLLQAKE